ncbi:MAG: histidinol-phosphate transaminase [Lachnospiraceae bacterium]|nr:histidinol-phosphate transaminase [Lachnospiraceae bacterium]
MREWEKNFRQVEPYTPGEQPDFPDMIKLNTNECPYPPTPRAAEALRELAQERDRLRLYPDFRAGALTECLAHYYGLTQEQIFVGVGSDDVLSVAFLTFFNSEKPVLFPDITYSFYDVWAELYRIPYERPALDENFRIRREDYYRENGGIVIANPNAPTSIAEGTEFIEDILKHNRQSVVIVDEAYVDFGAVSALPLLEKYENLLVVQTFSKSRAMAGMRIGYAMGHPSLIRAMNDVKYSINSYTMNASSLVCGVCAVEDDAYFKECCARIMRTRAWARDRLAELGFACLESSANFLFASHESIPAKRIFEALREKNIFVRYFAKPRIDNYLRITIGTDEQMQALVNALEEIVKG